MEDHSHGEDGHVIMVTQPDPVLEAAKAEDKAVRLTSAAEIEIARIRADAEIEIAKIQAGISRHADATEVEVAEVVTEPPPPVEPGPAPEVLPVEVEPDPEETDPPVAEEHHETHHAKRRTGLGLWQ